jgi:acyl-CoA thioesterase II
MGDSIVGRDCITDYDIEELFAVDRIDVATWRGRRVDPRGGRMYGGTVAAQLLAAARATSQHAAAVSNVELRFVRPADGGQPVNYHVESVYSGPSSALRRVTAVQHGSTVAIGAATFHTPRDGWTHGVRPLPIPPDALPSTGTPHRSRAVTQDDFDIRYYDERAEGVLTRRLWFRAARPAPTVLGVHECALLYISDIYFFELLCLEHGYAGNDRALRYATTQHSVWFHSAPKVDDWLLIESRSPVLSGGRGLVSGDVCTIEGRSVATVIQEAVIWVVDDGSPSRSENALV